MRHLPGILFLLVAACPYLAMILTDHTERPADEPEERLIILSPHRREVCQEYSRAFAIWMKEKYGRSAGIDWLDVGGGTSKIVKDLDSRFQSHPDRPGVDLLFGGGPDPFRAAKEQGWLEPVSVPEELLAEIPPRCAGLPVYDPEGYWYGVALSSFGILYSQPLLDRFHLPVPERWEDLADPAFFSWVASGDPSSSGSVHVCYEIILQAHGYEQGWSVIARLCANVRRFGESGGDTPREVAAGDAAVGKVIDQYAQTMIDESGGDYLRYLYPRDGTVISPDPIALVAHAPHPELSRLFIEFVLSEPGQRLLYQPEGTGGQRHNLHRKPVLARLYQTPGAPASNPYDAATDFVYDTALASERWTLLNDLVKSCLIDAHDDLIGAWKSVIDAGLPDDLVAELTRPPVPPGEIAAVIKALKESSSRNELRSRWGREARARYRRVRKQAQALHPATMQP